MRIIRQLQPLKNHVCGNCKPVPYIDHTNCHNDLCNFMIGKDSFCPLICFFGQSLVGNTCNFLCHLQGDSLFFGEQRRFLILSFIVIIFKMKNRMIITK